MSAFPSSLEEGDAVLRDRKRQALGAGHTFMVTVWSLPAPTLQLRTEADLKALSEGGLWSQVRLESPPCHGRLMHPWKVLATALYWLAALTRCSSLLSLEAPV